MDPLLIQAMQILGNNIAVMSGAIDRNTAALTGKGGRTPPTNSGSSRGGFGGLSANPILAPLALLAGKVGAVLGPLALLGSMLSSHTSGFEVFLTTGKMLGVVLGGLLMPGFVALAAATYALAMVMDEKLTPALEFFYTVVLADLVHTFQVLNFAAGKAGEAVDHFGKVLGKGANLFASMLVSLGGALKQVQPFGMQLPGVNEIDAALKGMAAILEAAARSGEAGGGDFGNGKEAGDRPQLGNAKPDALGALGGGAATTGLQPGGFMAHLVRGMRMAITSMQQAVAGQPHYTSGEQAYKDATLAGIGKDPFEKEMLDIMLKQLDAMNRVVAKLQPAVGP